MLEYDLSGMELQVSWSTLSLHFVLCFSNISLTENVLEVCEDFGTFLSNLYLLWKSLVSTARSNKKIVEFISDNRISLKLHRIKALRLPKTTFPRTLIFIINFKNGPLSQYKHATTGLQCLQGFWVFWFS